MEDVRDLAYLALVEYDGELAGPNPHVAHGVRVDAPHIVYGRWGGLLEFMRYPELTGAPTLKCWSPGPPEIFRSHSDVHTGEHEMHLSFAHVLFPTGVVHLGGLWFYAHLVSRDPPDLLVGYRVIAQERTGSKKYRGLGRCTLLTGVYLTVLRTKQSPQLIGVRG